MNEGERQEVECEVAVTHITYMVWRELVSGVKVLKL